MTKEKKRKIVLEFGHGRFVISSDDDDQYTNDEDVQRNVKFANDMIYEKHKSGFKKRR